MNDVRSLVNEIIVQLSRRSRPSVINHQPSVIAGKASPSIINHQPSVITGKASPSVIPPKAVIWIINPFDQLPNESDVPLRYWALCRTFAAQGYEVIWWSSDFSHLTKAKRQPCPDTDGFSVRLVETPPYSKNISFARLKNHKAFAEGFYRDAMAGLKSGELKAPHRIVVSLPPLGVAEAAFKIRDFVNRSVQLQQANHANVKAERSLKRRATAISHQPLAISHHDHCEVIVDIMDAWPETFYQALPKPLRRVLGPILLAPMHRSAKRAYQGADKISAVGQSYLELAQKYLGQEWKVKSEKYEGRDLSSQASAPAGIQEQGTRNKELPTPTHLCYHGTDLSRFRRDKSEGETVRSESEKQLPLSSQPLTPKPLPSTLHSSHSTHHSERKPLKAVYLGAMGSGYDLMTLIEVAARWKAEGVFPCQIHFAGTGSQANQLMTHSKLLITEERIVFHGFLQKNAVNALLLSADLALVPNRPDSLVACPYKAGEYAAAGLPMLSCLGGELGELLNQWDAGCEYNEGDADSLHAAFEDYSEDLELLKQQSLNARKMAEAIFDRTQTYSALCDFILQ